MLNFIKLIDWKKALTIFILGLISGGVSFMFLSFINLLIGVVLEGGNSADVNYLIYFCFLMLGFIWTRRALSYVIIKFSQRVFWTLRSDVLETLLKANYHQVEERKDQIYASLVHDVGVLTRFSLSIINFLSALVMTLGCFVYLGIQSTSLLWITILVSLIGVAIYWIGVFLNKRKMEYARKLEDDFMKHFTSILDGFKEIHMNPKIGKDIFNWKIKGISNESYKNNTEAFTGFLNVQITGEVLFYCLIAVILLYNTYFFDESATAVVNYVFILLYLLAGINNLMLIIPEIVSARIASNKIERLRKDLNDERFDNTIEQSQMSISEFEELSVTNLVFKYRSVDRTSEMGGNGTMDSPEGFSVGPVSFALKKGEAVFIYGGNGSGKTTMVNTILGIFSKDDGEITFNGTELTATNYSEYRALFSVVFSDFHLFDELYGLESINEEQINDYIKLFELEKKVTYQHGAFSSNKLSTGQRKRLGLIQALIRSKPILVLDEWAADQDPVFRKKFYTEIIPILKEKGYSIIAITHDDAYYHMADKLYKMDQGKLSEDTSLTQLKSEM